MVLLFNRGLAILAVRTQERSMAVSKEQFRKVLGHFATGVTVVTTRHHTGEPWGFTVNSFTSVSLEPPLILVCVDLKSESHHAMATAKYFAVNFLSEDQREMSRHFASKSTERFKAVPHTYSAHDCPLIDGCLGFVECEKVGSNVYGDHTIIVGEVLDGSVAAARPLLFFGSAYARLEVEAPPQPKLPSD